jgi:molybdopterin-guanine dinucleotide biosynthesis protein A
MPQAERSNTSQTARRPVGVVLAGGESRRLGRDKAIVEVGGVGLAARAASRLISVCREITVADGGRGVIDGMPSVPDGPGAGPAAGILGAAQRFPGRALLVLACDLPNVPAALLGNLAKLNGDWVVPRHGGQLEPLCSLFRPAALSALAEIVAGGENALHRLTGRTDLELDYLEGPSLEVFGRPDEMFVNINRPEDLERFESR